MSNAAKTDVTVEVPAAAGVRERPLVSPLARRQAERGEPVTTRRHETLNPADFEREVLRHLDGAADRPAIVAKVMERVTDGTLTVQQDGRPVTAASEAGPLLAGVLAEVLGRFLRYSLLVEADSSNG